MRIEESVGGSPGRSGGGDILSYGGVEGFPRRRSQGGRSYVIFHRCPVARVQGGGGLGEKRGGGLLV